MVDLEFFDDPAAFLDVAGSRLASDPVLSTVVSVVTTRIRDDDAAGVGRPPEVPMWWVLVRDGGDRAPITGLGMRTAKSPPHPLYLLPMSEDAAATLARHLHRRGEHVAAVNGALPASRTFLEEMARLTGGTVRVVMHVRLFELGELATVRRVPGRLREATAADLPLVERWVSLFMADADEQAGRARGASANETPSRDDLLQSIQQGGYGLWLDEGGEPVSLAAASAPAFGVSRVAPVYTPAEHRRHGYASAAVAAVSARLLDQGARVCLFTDQANPTSNGIYQRIGYRPVVDMASLVLDPRPRHAGRPRRT